MDAADSAGRTPLHRHMASRCRRKVVVNEFLAKGADATATDNEGRTLLHEAARRNPRDPLAELLRKHGARD